jgi:tRNA1Val (adenine37-N6)-methyltransferase
VLCTIDDVAGAASRALKSGGHLYMVHRPHRLGDLMHALEAHNLALKRMRMVHPFADREANLVLSDAAKGGRMYVHVEKPLVIYRQAGVYTEEVKALYG